jgi:hypothetical protein
MKNKKDKTLSKPMKKTVEFDYLTVIATISCNEKLWEKEL